MSATTNAAAFAARYGTPLYVYDLDRVETARRDLFASLPEGFTLFYALKANPHPDVVRALRAGAGPACRAEISSTGELSAALDAGFTGADCLYTGPGKTGGELAGAIGRGVRLFSAESVTDLEHIGAAAAAQGVTADCLLRVNSASASATTSIRMTGTPSQFGFDSETLAGLAPALTGIPGTRIAGAHFFPLSNAKDEDSLIAEFRHTIGLAAEIEQQLGLDFRMLDIGGGFAAPYGVRGERPRYPHLRAELEQALDQHFPRWRAGGLEVACESGRYLVADSGWLVCGVVNTKESRGRRYVVLDAGINAFGGLSGLGRLLPVAVEPDGHRADGAAPAERANLVGPLCTPGDILGREIDLPSGLSAGDLVTIPNAGSYGVTASLLMFLGRTAPSEVAVRGGEAVSVSRLEHHRVAYGGGSDWPGMTGSAAGAVVRVHPQAVSPAHSGTVLLSGLVSDAHTWNLVYLQLLIEELGYRVVNLGSCVSEAELVSACLLHRPGLVVISSVNGHGHLDGLRAIRGLRACLPLAGTPVVIGGKLGIDGAGDHVEDLLAAGFDAVFEDGADGVAAFRSFIAEARRRAAL